MNDAETNAAMTGDPLPRLHPAATRRGQCNREHRARQLHRLRLSPHRRRVWLHPESSRATRGISAETKSATGASATHAATPYPCRKRLRRQPQLHHRLLCSRR